MSRIGRYEVESEIGRGAMGVVYVARDPRLERRVAVKTHNLPAGLSAEQQREFRVRFVREARAAAALSHPGIVTIYDADEDPERGLPFISMEYVEGRSLRQVLDERGRLEPETAVSMIADVAEALHVAHQAGIIHRDIKPANLLIRDRDRAIKVTDFGVARISTSELTQTGTSLGTPAYMSPEQIEGGPVDSRSDLFSLAVILYEALCGQRPFAGENVTAVIHAVTREAPLPITKRVEGLPRSLDTFLDTALAKRADQRFASGREFREALEQALRADPAQEIEGTRVVEASSSAPPASSAPPVDWSPPRRAGASTDFGGESSTWWRRKRVLAAAAVVLLLLGGWALLGGGEDAYLQLDAKSSVEAGELTLFVDGEQVYSRRLNAPRKHKGFIKKILDQNQETFEAWIEIEAGKHEITASILPDGANEPYHDTVVLDIETGETRKLKLVAGRTIGRALSLKVN